MKSLLEFRAARFAVAAIAAAGLSASLGTGAAAAARTKPDVVTERSGKGSAKVAERRPSVTDQGRKVG